MLKDISLIRKCSPFDPRFTCLVRTDPLCDPTEMTFGLRSTKERPCQRTWRMKLQ